MISRLSSPILHILFLYAHKDCIGRLFRFSVYPAERLIAAVEIDFRFK